MNLLTLTEPGLCQLTYKVKIKTIEKLVNIKKYIKNIKLYF